jgi:hypothetical protein
MDRGGTVETVSARACKSDALAGIRGRPIEIPVREDVKMSTAWIAVDTFGELGFEARLVTDKTADVSPDRILFIGGNALWHERALDRVRALPRLERPGVVVWHSEPLPLPSSSGTRPAPLTAREIAKIVLRDRRISDPHSNARYMRRLAREGIVDVLTVATRSYQAFLAEQGIHSAVVPVGYHRVHGNRRDSERDIDVLFLGDLRVRRRRRILRRLMNEGVPVRALGSYSDARYWGESRNALLNRTRILLNLPRHPGLLADMRLILGMATGAMVLSEPVHLPDPYVPGTHYVETPLDQMAEVAARYLADEDARSAIADAGHAFVTRELTLKNCFAELLAFAAERLRKTSVSA